MAARATAEGDHARGGARIGAAHAPQERDADRLAEAMVAPVSPAALGCTACTPGAVPCQACAAGKAKLLRSPIGPAAAESGAPSALAGALAAPGAPLPERLRAKFERRLGGGTDLSPVRLHVGEAPARAAASVNAHAFALARDIVLGGDAPAPDTAAGERLLAHEVAHTLQGGEATPTLRRQAAPGGGASPPTSGSAGGGVCQAPDGRSFSFVGPRPPPAPPASQPTEIQVTLPGTGDQPARTQTVVLQEPVTSATPIVFYAIPKALTNLAGADQVACTVPPPAATAARGEDEPRGTTVPPMPGVPASPPATPSTVTVQGQPVTPERVTDAYVIVSEYHHLAVGAGATTLLETAQGVRLIDAGVGTDGGADISAAIADRVGALLRGRPIAEVMITHLHADHTNLLPRLAERFPIGRIRVNAVQFADPRFAQLLADIAAAQARGARARAEAEFDAGRSDWEKGAGSRIADAALREEAYQNAKRQHVAEALQRLAREPTQVELLVPSGGRLVAGDAPLGSLRDLTSATTDPVTEGLRRSAPPGSGGISDTAFTDPAAGRTLAAQRARQATDPAARVPDVDIDTASTSYIIDLPGGNRLMIVPDVRTDDLRRHMRDATGARRANLEAELARLGHPARFQAWNMTHHMQSGWVAGGAPHIAGPGELDAFIALLQNVREAQAAARPGGTGAAADMVVVSAQHEALARSLVNPAMVWFLRACGFEVFLAASGRDVRLIEATTAGGQKIEGVSGLPAEGLRPADPLLTQSEAAMRYLDGLIEDQRVRKAPARMPTADKAALVADRTAQINRLTAARDAIRTARETYIRTVSQEIWRGAHDASRPAVAPDPARPQPAAMQAAEQALRDAMAAPDLRDFTAPRPGETPVISDTALVLLRRQGDAPLDTAARRVMEANQRADVLRRRLQAGERPAETRAELTAVLNELRDAISAQLPNSPEASRPVLQEELVHAQRELESLVRSREGEVRFSREPGTGRLIENRVVQAPAGQGPTAADRVRSAAESAGQFLGAIMVYQTIRESEELAQRVQTGGANTVQGVVGTVHTVQGITIGVRMMSLVHVHPGEFVVMSVLNVTQAAAGDYDSPEARALAVSRTAITEGVNLFLMVLSQAMMRSGNPYVVAAGFSVMFLAHPIVSLLDYVGVFDAIERASAFLPAEVTGANQHLRALMQEYRAIIGAMQLAARSDEELRGAGATDPAAIRASSDADITANRARARDKEGELLTAFEEGYARARTEYAGLHELDMLHGQFLAMREEAHRDDAAAGTSATAALDAFARMDRALSMAQMTAAEARTMPQWSRLDEALGELEALLRGASPDAKDVREKQAEVLQMLRNARYRVDPAAAGLRSQPLLPDQAPGRAAYMEKLGAAEARLARAQAALLPGVPAAAFAGGTPTPEAVDAALAAYEALIAQAPQHPDPAVTFRSSEAASVTYRAFVAEHADYGRFLERLHAAEMALQSLAAGMRRGAAYGPPTALEAGLPARIRTAMSRRRDQFGLLFLDEIAAVSGASRQRETQTLAPLLGEAPGTRPLTPEEQEALSRGRLEDAGRGLSTVSNRLDQVAGLSVPTAPDGRVGGVYRLSGTIEWTELLITSIPSVTVAAEENVLVGRTAAPPQRVTSSMGHFNEVQIVPLNAAAVRRLGTGVRRVPEMALQPVMLRDLQPQSTAAQGGAPARPGAPTPAAPAPAP